MAHLLRGKQAGVSNDLSAGLGPDLFVLDHVRTCTPIRPAPRMSKLRLLRSELTGADSQLRHKFKDHPNRLRSRPVPHRHRHQREPVWQWPDLRLWAEAGRGCAAASSPCVGQDTAVLRRQDSVRRLEERPVRLLARDKELGQRALAACEGHGAALRPHHRLCASRYAVWRRLCVRSG